MNYLPINLNDDYKVKNRAYKSNIDKIDLTSLDLPNLFGLPFPLGEILYQKYTTFGDENVIDDNLKDIN